MMRVLLLAGIIILMGGSSSAALQSPFEISLREELNQSCTRAHGVYAVLKQGASDFPVCFFGEAIVGAESWSKFGELRSKVQSLEAYRNRPRRLSSTGGVCGAFSAELVTAKDAKGSNYNFCRFEDQSLLDETTLWLGPGASISDSLDKAITKLH